MSALTSWWPESTRETDDMATPARDATSRMLALGRAGWALRCGEFSFGPAFGMIDRGTSPDRLRATSGIGCRETVAHPPMTDFGNPVALMRSSGAGPEYST